MSDTTAPCQTLGSRPNSCDRIGLANAGDRYTFFTIDPAPLADHFQRHLDALQSGLETTD
jgi:hypothetical protein